MRLVRILASLLFALSSFAASKPLRIEIRQGVVEPEPIALVSFLGDTSDMSLLGDQISEVIGQDLKNSGLFRLIDPASFIQPLLSLVRDGIRLKDWRVLKTHFAVWGTIRPLMSGKYSVSFHLSDVISGKSLLNLCITGSKNQWRRIAHIIADHIYSRITGESGVFNSHIIFVEPTSADRRNPKARLVRMDQDGANPTPLTGGNNLVMTPRYSPDGRKVAYLSYTSASSAEVFILDLVTNNSHRLGNFEGMTYTPRFSPDGQTLVMGMIKKGKSAIYTLDLRTNRLLQLTKHVSIDTSPCFSPDGQNIVFTSDREGKENIFVMNRNGGDVRRISFGDGKYSQPVWSPRGDLIAFAKQIRGQFYIGVMKPDGTGERMIASSYLVESPSWSSNGRYVIYPKQTGPGAQTQLWVSDLTGHFSRRIKTNKKASEGTWSPVLK